MRIYKCVTASLQVMSPNGGESLPGGSLHMILDGTANPDGSLELYFHDGVTRTLLTSGRHRAVLPVDGADHHHHDARIEIESKVTAGTEATDASDATARSGRAPPPPPIDFNGDGRSDILWHHQGNGDLYSWFLNGTVAAAGSYLTPPVRRHQLEDPGRRRLRRRREARHPVAPPGDGRPLRLVHERNGRGQRGLPHAQVLRRHHLADPGVADFDHDGKPDILWHHQGTGDLYVWCMSGTVVTGSYLNPSRFADTHWQIRGVVDLTKDGKPDLLWHHQGTGDLYVWAMDGTVVTWGSYLKPSRFADTNWQIRRVADFNGDGQLDLLWHHQATGELYVWFMDGLAVTGGSDLTPAAFSDVQWQIMPR